MKEVDLTLEKSIDVKKFLVMQYIQSNEDEIIFKVDNEGKQIVNNVCRELEYDCETSEKDNMYLIKIKKTLELKGSVSDDANILIPLPPKNVYEKILNPAILTIFIPQIKGVSILKEGVYKLRIKWVISWDTPLTVYSLKLDEDRYIVRYLASQKVSVFTILFGFDFYLTTEGSGSRVKMKEWYKGPFKSLAKSEIEKHLRKAKDSLPDLLIKV